GSRERHGESQPIVLRPFIRELSSFGNTHDPTSQVFLNLGLEDRSKYLREGGRAKHAPSKVDPSAQLRLAARSGCSWYFQSQLPSSSAFSATAPTSGSKRFSSLNAEWLS